MNHIIITGPQGSGKTTLAKTIVARMPNNSWYIHEDSEMGKDRKKIFKKALKAKKTLYIFCTQREVVQEDYPNFSIIKLAKNVQ